MPRTLVFSRPGVFWKWASRHFSETPSQSAPRGFRENREGAVGVMGDGEASPPPPARMKPWRALDFMLASERALANPYVRAFVDEKPLLERFLHDPAMAHWSKKSNLRKEVTEAMGALTQIRLCVPKARDGDGDVEISDGCGTRDEDGEVPHDSGSGLVFVDLCSGSGMLSIVVAHFFPAARVLMVDANPKIKLPHLACLPTVEHHLLDVQSTKALDLVRGAVRDATRACIVVGVHLCGDLSRRAVQLFLETESHALVLCPCCLPRRRRHDVFGFHVVDQARSLKREPHGVWCMALHGLLPWRDRETFAVDVRVDDDVEGPFKTFLLARRKKHTREPAKDGGDESETVCPRVENLGSEIEHGKEGTRVFRGVVAGRRASRWRVIG